MSTTGAVSQSAERLGFLRQQLADLQYFVDNPRPSTDGRSKAARLNRKTRENRDLIESILRGLAVHVIAGADRSLMQTP